MDLSIITTMDILFNHSHTQNHSTINDPQIMNFSLSKPKIFKELFHFLQQDLLIFKFQLATRTRTFGIQIKAIIHF